MDELFFNDFLLGSLLFGGEDLREVGVAFYGFGFVVDCFCL